MPVSTGGRTRDQWNAAGIDCEFIVGDYYFFESLMSPAGHAHFAEL